MEDWAEIRRLAKSDGLSIKEITRQVGVSRNTVRTALRSEAPPSYKRKKGPSVVDEFEPEIRRLLISTPRMPATVIAERIGWTRSITVLKDRVRELRPLYLPPDPSGRTEYRPGELAQWDLWFPAVDIPIETGPARLPVVVGVSGYSRWMEARMIPSREAHDILSGNLACLIAIGAVPKSGVYDNEGALVSRHGQKVTLSAPFQSFRGVLGMKVIVLRPRDPESKGVVERHNGYLETSFLPGRSFSGPTDFNAQLEEWLVHANNRVHATLRCRPSERFEEDKKAMMPLPPVLPDTSFRTRTRLGRDHWVRVGTCDYSVHPRVIGRLIEVIATTEEVVVTCAGEVVAHHERSWAKHRTLTDPEHDRAREQMRIARGLLPLNPKDDEVEVRDLSVYDRATGVA